MKWHTWTQWLNLAWFIIGIGVTLAFTLKGSQQWIGVGIELLIGLPIVIWLGRKNIEW